MWPVADKLPVSVSAVHPDVSTLCNTGIICK